MPDPRRIVADSSALIPAFMPDGRPDVDRRAKELLNAIERRAVVAFAPEVLMVEFMNRLLRELTTLRVEGYATDPQIIVERQWLEFQRLSIIYTPAAELSLTAWDAASRHSVSGPDSWFCATAVLHDAELWLSHPPSDQSGELARRFGAKVHYLSAEPFVQRP